MSRTFHRAGRDAWNHPRAPHDPSLRLQMHGPIQPMEQPGFFAQVRDGLCARLRRKVRK